MDIANFKSILGQLNRIEEFSDTLMNENKLSEEEFQDICDSTATIMTNLRIAKKRIENNETISEDN